MCVPADPSDGGAARFWTMAFFGLTALGPQNYMSSLLKVTFASNFFEGSPAASNTPSLSTTTAAGTAATTGPYNRMTQIFDHYFHPPQDNILVDIFTDEEYDAAYVRAPLPPPPAQSSPPQS